MNLAAVLITFILTIPAPCQRSGPLPDAAPAARHAVTIVYGYYTQRVTITTSYAIKYGPIVFHQCGICHPIRQRHDH